MGQDSNFKWIDITVIHYPILPLEFVYDLNANLITYPIYVRYLQLGREKCTSQSWSPMLFGLIMDAVTAARER